MTAKETLYCSFCAKSQHEVRKLIAGPAVFICDECTELCRDIVADELPREDGLDAEAIDRRFRFAAIAASLFSTFKDWGRVRDDGKWKSFDSGEVYERAVSFTKRLLNEPEPFPRIEPRPRPMHPEDIGLTAEGRMP